MPAFDYEALDERGRTKRGVVSADTARLARRELKRKQLVPLKVVAAMEDEGGSTGDGTGRLGRLVARLQRSPALSAKDLTLTTRQLATLISAAAPVEEALNTVALQSEKPVVRKTLLAVRSQVMEGQRLGDSLARHPRSFSPLYRSMVSAGENSGSLGPVMERLADYLERSHAMRSKVVSAMIYPAFLAITAVAVIILLMTFVVPEVVDQFDDMGQTLPLLTRIMIGVSEALQSYGLGALAVLTLGGIVAVRALKSPAVRERVDRSLLRLPLVGRLAREMNAARLDRQRNTGVGGTDGRAQYADQRQPEACPGRGDRAGPRGQRACHGIAPNRGISASGGLYGGYGREGRPAGGDVEQGGRLSGTRIRGGDRHGGQPDGTGDYYHHGRRCRLDRVVDHAADPSVEHNGAIGMKNE